VLIRVEHFSVRPRSCWIKRPRVRSTLNRLQPRIPLRRRRWPAAAAAAASSPRREASRPASSNRLIWSTSRPSALSTKSTGQRSTRQERWVDLTATRPSVQNQKRQPCLEKTTIHCFAPPFPYTLLSSCLDAIAAHYMQQPAPFVVRGPTYLKDRKKIPAGFTAFTFGAMDVVTMPHPVEHVARYLRSIR